MARLSPENFDIGILCALHSELAAVEAILDEEYEDILLDDANVSNVYSLGRIHQHKVVVACLPAPLNTSTATASVVADMKKTFARLRFILMVGVGSGIPNLQQNTTQRDTDIRLGDVVVGLSTERFAGSNDYGATGVHFKDTLASSPTGLLMALQKLRSKQERKESQVPVILADMLQRNIKMSSLGYGFPGRANDVLFRSDYDHVNDIEGTDCSLCNTGEQVVRSNRPHDHPVTHYGIIASVDQVICDTKVRETLRRDYDVICIETEASGLADGCSCLLIRGIGDYADTHSNDQWKLYAQAVAAAYTKELLSFVPATQAEQFYLAKKTSVASSLPTCVSLQQSDQQDTKPKCSSSEAVDSLSQAAMRGDEAMVRELLKGGVDIEARSPELKGNTPLYEAAKYGKERVIQILLAWGANMEARSANAEGRTPLHTAVTHGHQEVVKLLLKYGADIDAICDGGAKCTPLYSAVLRRDKPMANLLLAEGAKLDVVSGDKYALTPLKRAVVKIDAEMVKILLEKGAGTEFKGADGKKCTALHTAARRGFKDIVKLLLEHGADPNARSEDSEQSTPIYEAAAAGHQAIVKLLLDWGADSHALTSVCGIGPLHIAAKHDHIEVVRLLLERGGKTHHIYPTTFECEDTPLHCAARAGRAEVAKLLINKGANPDFRLNGQTALHVAVEHDQRDMVQMLLDKGADPDIKNKFGCTPLCCAAQGGKRMIVQYLLEHGADSTIANQFNHTPLIAAVQKGRDHTVETLLKRGVNPNLPSDDHHRCTPLHVAARDGREDIVRILLSRGAIAGTRNANGQTPRDLALLKKHHNLAKLLATQEKQGFLSKIGRFIRDRGSVKKESMVDPPNLSDSHQPKDNQSAKE